MCVAYTKMRFRTTWQNDSRFSAFSTAQMSLIRFLFSKRFFKNFLAALLLVTVVPLVLYLYLGWYTGHGDHRTVPDVRGLTVASAEQELGGEELSLLVVDSIYTEDAVPGMVFEQNPSPFSEVKRGRAVYLTVYRSTPPSERLKVAEGTNERVAEIILQNRGIRYEKQYEEHAYLSGMVVRVLHRGKELDPSSLIKRGDKVTLIIGTRSNEKVPMPELRGLPLDSARSILVDSRLSLGAVLYDKEVLTAEDSLASRVYRQIPSSEEDKPILVGTPVDLFLGLNDLSPDDFRAPDDQMNDDDLFNSTEP